ncbi:MAG: hypothetical protein M3115_02770 [Thermoproteota archaeon]|nr:hypothetical protein [Thermoproteota archaeon]
MREQMGSPRSVLVIYRLKFKSKQGFDNAVQVFQVGEKLNRYVESLEKSFFLKSFEPTYPATAPPEVNLCKDDLVIYVCSNEDADYLKGYAAIGSTPNKITKKMPRALHYYELFLKSTFGSIADLSITVGDPN